MVSHRRSKPEKERVEGEGERSKVRKRGANGAPFLGPPLSSTAAREKAMTVVGEETGRERGRPAVWSPLSRPAEDTRGKENLWYTKFHIHSRDKTSISRIWLRQWTIDNDKDTLTTV